MPCRAFTLRNKGKSARNHCKYNQIKEVSQTEVFCHNLCLCMRSYTLGYMLCFYTCMFIYIILKNSPQYRSKYNNNNNKKIDSMPNLVIFIRIYGLKAVGDRILISFCLFITTITVSSLKLITQSAFYVNLYRAVIGPSG